MAVNFIIGRKVGMTRIFDDIGTDYPVTIIEAGPCEVTQIKSVEKEGYSSIQMGFMDKSNRHSNKPQKGHFDNAGVSVKKIFIVHFCSIIAFKVFFIGYLHTNID